MRHCKKCERPVKNKHYCLECRKKYMVEYRMDNWYEDSRAKYLRTGEWVINRG